ncbi:hypothetical protein EB796_018510 [Bugula neritina]|uniref:Uncharacterized protein n=1 Tax=Bugula neritina TaxID=10212 RepID=A0A7J7JB35_BUGNE|nr:hypothetical protein EB796_018510 [Bugula neritina]
MVEHKMMDEGIANIIKGMAPRLAAPNACDSFKASRPVDLPVGPVGKRASASSEDNLQKEVINMLDSPEGIEIMQKEVDGKLTGIPAPKFASGGFSGVGKRQASSDSANDVLNILDSWEGKQLMDDKVSGKNLNIPPPKYNSAGFHGYKRFIRRQTKGTSHYDIANGKHDGHATKASALLQRVRNISVNQSSLGLFFAALDDGTVRAAMYNVCNCNSIAATIRSLYISG